MGFWNGRSLWMEVELGKRRTAEVDIVYGNLFQIIQNHQGLPAAWRHRAQIIQMIDLGRH